MNLMNKTMLAVTTALLGVVVTSGSAMAANGVAVAKSVQGKVVLQRDGKQKLLNTGEVLLQNDSVITLNGSAVELMYNKTNCTKSYDASRRLLVSESAQCANARLVKLGIKKVPVGSGGFPVTGTVVSSGAMGAAGAAGAAAAGAAGAAAAGAAGIAGLGLGAIGAGLLGVAAVAAVVNDNNKDDDKPVSKS